MEYNYRQNIIKFDSLVNQIFRLNIWQKKGLDKLKIKTAGDLLRYFPSRYQEPAKMKQIAELAEGDNVFLQGKVSEIKLQKTWRKKINIAEARLTDPSGAISVVWFNQPYIAKILKEGDILTLNGKVSRNKNELYLANPIFELGKNVQFGNLVSEFRNLLSVYAETRGISSRWLNFAVSKILKSADEKEFCDCVPANILKKYHLPDFKQSLFSVHLPRSLKTAEAAKKRFAFEEIFLIQLSRLKNRLARNGKQKFKVNVDYKKLKLFCDSLPFDLTTSQKKAIFRISEDFRKNQPMARLLEGDVGSGKTMVALAISYLVVQSGWQVAYMAPTEILARQHFETFIKHFPENVKIGLITSSECEKFPSKINPAKPTHISKSQLLKWVKSGEIQILIGTHSLIQEKVFFRNLALTIVDEQHRFGVKQRLKAVIKGQEQIPHLLSMTATPIPRTLALTIYGDLDLTLLDEMPPGRKAVMTYVVPPNQRQRAYEHIREEIKNGRQAYVVCPRIESADKSVFGTPQMEMKAVKEEFEKLSKDIFPEYRLATLHGKLLPKEKEKIMAEFKKGKINILVATSVIEVGIDVPNANCILIEGADRFGLAQLHQLRGRVLRSTYQSHCFILSDSLSLKTLKRLSALRQAKNGFELAEYDLKFRGPGELSGKKQWGISDIGMEALKNIKLVEAARLEAAELLKKDRELKNFPDLKLAIKNCESDLHLE